MRKQTRPVSSPRSALKSPTKPALRLSLETVKVLVSEELSHVVSGCPWTTSPTTDNDGI
jgi:hypothetical protein